MDWPSAFTCKFDNGRSSAIERVRTQVSAVAVAGGDGVGLSIQANGNFGQVVVKTAIISLRIIREHFSICLATKAIEQRKHYWRGARHFVSLSHTHDSLPMSLYLPLFGFFRFDGRSLWLRTRLGHELTAQTMRSPVFSKCGLFVFHVHWPPLFAQSFHSPLLASNHRSSVFCIRKQPKAHALPWPDRTFFSFSYPFGYKSARRLSTLGRTHGVDEEEDEKWKAIRNQPF